MSPYGLDDRDWRRLLALAALMRAAAPQLPRLHVLRRCDSVGAALGKLGVIARETAHEATDDEEAVALVTERWCAEIDSTLAGRTIPADEREVLEGVRALAPDARPDNPFQELFDRVEEEAADVYDTGWPGSTLNLEKCMQHPRPGDDSDPYAVTAVTDTGGRVVSLHLHPPGLGPATWASLPSLLVHECVCHVPARQGGVEDNTSPFAEGFMHWAAMFFFERWGTLIDPALAPAARAHAPAFWEKVSKPSLPPGAARHNGMVAADRLATHAEAELGLPYDVARPRVARLAVELNLTDAPLAVKDNLVARLGRPGWDSRFEGWIDALLKLELSPAELLNCICMEMDEKKR